MRKRLLSLILALALMTGASPSALAAGRPVLVCDADGTGRAVLSLEELRYEGVCGVQLELKLAGEYPACTFTPSSRTAYAPDCSVQVFRGETAVTVYLTDRTALDRDGWLELGELDLGVPASDGVWPDTAQATLLDERLRPLSGAGTISVVLPAGNDPAPQPSLPGQSAGFVVPPFIDVRAGDWFYEAVGYAYGRGLMRGLSADLFVPDAATDRAMIVTILHRLEGSPAALPAAFTDVPAGAYYAAPVAWASANGIVTGYEDGNFRPETPISREQMAAILYRYAQYKKLNASSRGDLGRFPDASAVSLYASEAMSWAVAAGLINGTDGMLVPGGSASRAQVAAIFQRLCVNVLEAA